MACRISASLGSGVRASRAVAVIIMPGVQKPHCRPCSWKKPSCTGCSTPPCSSPSTVATAAPSACTASSVHDLAGTPSTSTVQAPQLVVSQPMCVPVRPATSRMKWTSSSRGSMSASTACPLIVSLTCCVAVIARLLLLLAGTPGAAPAP